MINGDAWTWWGQARTSGYTTGGRPRSGAVMVFKRAGTMRRGHVAVVRDVVSSREVVIDHANWATRHSGRKGRVDRGVSVIDVSPRNDWSMVRVWYPVVDDYGTSVYPLYGFIYGGQGGEPRIEEAVIEVDDRAPDAVPTLPHSVATLPVRATVPAPGTLDSQLHGATVQIRAGKPVVMGRPVASAGDPMFDANNAVEPARRPTERADEPRRPAAKPRLVSTTSPVRHLAAKPAAAKATEARPETVAASSARPPALPTPKPNR